MEMLESETIIFQRNQRIYLYICIHPMHELFALVMSADTVNLKSPGSSYIVSDRLQATSMLIRFDTPRAEQYEFGTGQPWKLITV